MSPNVPSWTGVAASLVLVLVAAGIARRGRLGVERDLLIASVRAFVQLVAVGDDGCRCAALVAPGQGERPQRGGPGGESGGPEH